MSCATMTADVEEICEELHRIDNSRWLRFWCAFWEEISFYNAAVDFGIDWPCAYCFRDLHGHSINLYNVFPGPEFEAQHPLPPKIVDCPPMYTPGNSSSSLIVTEEVL
jgi:hypothetical protein